DERGKDVCELGSVRGHRAVVELGIGRTAVQRTAHPYLPDAKRDECGEGYERQPEVREDESAATEHSSPPSVWLHRWENGKPRRRARVPTSPGVRWRRIHGTASGARRAPGRSYAPS